MDGLCGRFSRPHPVRTVLVWLLLLGLTAPAPGVWQITEARAQAVPKAVVLDFVADDADVGSVDLLADLLRQELGAGGRVDLVSASATRSKLGGASRCFGKDCALSGGTALGASRVVVGRVSRDGSPFRLELRAYDVASGAIVSSLRRDVETEDALFLAVPALAGTVVEWIRRPIEAEPAETLPTTPVTPPTPRDPVPAAPSVVITHTPVERGTEGQPLDLEATVSQLTEGHQVLVMYRVVGDGRLRYTQMRVREGNQFVGQIPANRMSRSGVEYYIDVVDGSGNLVSRQPAGDRHYTVAVQAGRGAPPQQPPSDRGDDADVPVARGDSEGGGKKWWLIGGLAAAAGVVVALVAGGGGGGGDDTPVLEELPEPPAHK